MTLMISRNAWLLAGACLGLTAMVNAPAAHAAPYPQQPIRLVLGFSAGGGTDVIARAIAQKMSEGLGTSVIVENAPGANGNIAAQKVASASPDGYTLLYNTSSVILSPSLYSNLPYDPMRDLTGVGLAANQPIILVANPAAPVSSVQDIVTTLKQKPDTLNYGSAGNGNITHLSMLMFENAIGAHGTHVPYRGEAPALVDLMGGRVQLYMGTSAGVMPMIRDNRVRALAVGSPQRLESLKDTPTLSETTGKPLELGAWSGIMAPAGTPPTVIETLHAALNKALQDPDLQSRFAAQSAQVRQSATPGEYNDFLRSELERWASLIQQTGVKLD